MVWQSEGRFSFDDVYNAPLPIRRFWITQIEKKINPDVKNNTPNVDKIPKRPRKQLK